MKWRVVLLAMALTVIIRCCRALHDTAEDASKKRSIRGTFHRDTGEGMFESSSFLRDSRSMEGDQPEVLNRPDYDANGHEPSKHVLRRAILYCKSFFDIENCWEEILRLVGDGDIRLIHRLWKLRALAIEADQFVLQHLAILGLTVTQDSIRETLAVKESLQYLPRHLKQGAPGQQIPYGIDMIRAMDVWDHYETRGEGVRVCIMDSGVYAEHPDFAQASLQGWDLESDFVTPWSEDGMGHGTHITGILAASDNDFGYVGVAPDVEVYIIRVFTTEGLFFGSDVVAAAEACRDNGANIISMSLGGRGFEQAEHDFFRDLYLEDGIISVASAGNTGGSEVTYPAGYDHVISVTACNEDKAIPAFATFNSFVDIAAPGMWNYSALPCYVSSYLSHLMVPLFDLKGPIFLAPTLERAISLPLEEAATPRPTLS
jgi:Subtilase family